MKRGLDTKVVLVARLFARLGTQVVLDASQKSSLGTHAILVRSQSTETILVATQN